MSLILEALRKLEREKQSPDAGLIVVGHTPWTGGAPGRSRAVLALLAVGLVGGGIGLGAWLTRTRTVATAHPSTPSNAVPSPPLAAVPPPTTLAPAVVAATPSPSPFVRSSPSPASVPTALPRPEAALTPPVPAPRQADAEQEEAVREVAVATPPPRGELKLQAISQRDGRPIAVINERLVREGESFDGVLVVRIGKAEVEVEVSGRRRTLTF